MTEEETNKHNGYVPALLWNWCALIWTPDAIWLGTTTGTSPTSLVKKLASQHNATYERTLEHGNPIDMLHSCCCDSDRESSSWRHISTRGKLPCVPSGTKEKRQWTSFPPCTVHNAIFNLMMHGKSVIVTDYNNTKSGVDTRSGQTCAHVQFEKEIPSMAISCVFHIALVNWLLFTWRIWCIVKRTSQMKAITLSERPLLTIYAFLSFRGAVDRLPVLRQSVKNAMQTLNILDITASVPVLRRSAAQGRCAIYPRSKDKKSKTVPLLQSLHLSWASKCVCELWDALTMQFYLSFEDERRMNCSCNFLLWIAKLIV